MRELHEGRSRLLARLLGLVVVIVIGNAEPSVSLLSGQRGYNLKEWIVHAASLALAQRPGAGGRPRECES